LDNDFRSNVVFSGQSSPQAVKDRLSGDILLKCSRRGANLHPTNAHLMFMDEGDRVEIECIRGFSAQRPVLLGFAPASLLKNLSFADVLDQDTQRGYQRRFNVQHSLDFRKYIQTEHGSTIPLTFNMRPREDNAWKVVDLDAQKARLEIASGAERILSQVDCQHRLGHLGDIDLELPFMCFIGLSAREEMEIFNVINSKAKGLNTSLLDFHDAQLCEDLASDRPELFIALFLNHDSRSPWHRQLDIGGTTTTGLRRRASLRTMQKALKRFLSQTTILKSKPTEEAAEIVLGFWSAVSLVLSSAWSKPRSHFLTKGIAVYALMDIAADIYNETNQQRCDRQYFSAALSDFALEFDWSTDGPLKGLGGESGVKAAVQIVRDARRKARFRMVASG
jgi:DNA sulfur modification protein DndB